MHAHVSLCMSTKEFFNKILESLLRFDVSSWERTAGGRNRTGTKVTFRGILSPLRLPIPPLRHEKVAEYYAINTCHVNRFCAQLGWLSLVCVQHNKEEG